MAKSPSKSATAKTGVPRINIGISEKDRAAIAQGLSRLLADTYTLYLTTHNFHWNVTGPMFNSLHAMFMEQYTELWNAVDPVAERIRSLGHHAPGSYAEFGKLTSLADVPTTPPAALEMVRILVEGHEAVACSPSASRCTSRRHGCCARCSKRDGSARSACPGLTRMRPLRGCCS
jgi:starvation-inducible DNA-binding protein